MITHDEYIDYCFNELIGEKVINGYVTLYGNNVIIIDSPTAHLWLINPSFHTMICGICGVDDYDFPKKILFKLGFNYKTQFYKSRDFFYYKKLYFNKS